MNSNQPRNRPHPSDVRIQPLPIAISPRIIALQRALQGTRAPHEVLAAFWQEVEAAQGPLIELLEDDPTQCIVTFLWRDTTLWHNAAHKDETHAQAVVIMLHVLTNRTRDDLRQAMMEHITGTDIWHRSYRLPLDLQSTYQLLPIPQDAPPFNPTQRAERAYWVNLMRHAIPDPLNPHRFPSKLAETELSILELPLAPKERWWQAQADVPRGTLTTHRIHSNQLKNERTLWLYLPPDYTEQNGPYPVAIFLDGEVWGSLLPLAHTLDNLTRAGKIPPMIALMPESIDNQTRLRELSCNPTFIAFLSDELLPWASSQWAITSDPTQTIIAGQSLGALTAAFAAHHAPHRFGKVLAQSASLWWAPPQATQETALPDNMDWLTAQFAHSEPLAVQFYLAVGKQEGFLQESAQRLRDLLMTKGYKLTYHEYNGGHDYLCWRSDIANGLIALCGG